MASVAGCKRQAGQTVADLQGGGGKLTADARVDPHGPVDRAYVDGLPALTAFDYRVCERSAALTGVQPAGAAADARGLPILVAIDSSGSMAARSGSGTRMDEARSAVASFLTTLPPGARGGLAVFGDTGTNRPDSKFASCAAPPHMLVPPEPVDRASIVQAADRLQPAGWTPLASGIAALTRDFAAGPGRKLLYIVSDGIETCGGDPVAAARDARERLQVVINVIGFGVVDARDRPQRALHRRRADFRRAMLSAAHDRAGQRYLGDREP